MAKCYPKAAAQAPEVWITAAVAVLCDYPASIVIEVTEPATGLPVRCKWLPTLFEIREACDQARAARRPHRNLACEATLGRRAAEAESKRRQPSDDHLDHQFRRLGLIKLRHPRKDGKSHLWERKPGPDGARPGAPEKFPPGIDKPPGGLPF